MTTGDVVSGRWLSRSPERPRHGSARPQSPGTLREMQAIGAAASGHPLISAFVAEFVKAAARLGPSDFTYAAPLLFLLEKLGCYTAVNGHTIRGPVSIPLFPAGPARLSAEEPFMWEYRLRQIHAAELLTQRALEQSPRLIPGLAQYAAHMAASDHARRIESEMLRPESETVSGGIESVGTLAAQTKGRVGGIDASAAGWSPYRLEGRTQGAMSPHQRAHRLVSGLARRGKAPDLLLCDRKTYAVLSSGIADTLMLRCNILAVDNFLMCVGEIPLLVVCADDRILGQTADSDPPASAMYALNTGHLRLAGDGRTPFSVNTPTAAVRHASGHEQTMSVSIESELQFICDNRSLQGSHWGAIL